LEKAKMDERYDPGDLRRFARELFAAAGMERDKAETVASILVEADMMGHDTHGLQLCAPYLEELESGGMRKAGQPDALSDRGAAVVWDGAWLPGVWLTARALDLASARAREHGLAAVAIRRSHHIACLQAYLLRATEKGQVAVIACSDPAAASMAPFGGLTPVFTPDPLAVGLPTDGDPILIDMSASITTNAMSERLHAAGRRYPGPWAQDAEGQPSDDPSVLFSEPEGSILPTGGKDHGHKGYALALMVESFTQGLSGFGRADTPDNWGAAVFVQVFEPEAFAGLGPFSRQTGWIAAACRAARPAPGVAAVRLPGQKALERRRRALEEGVDLYPGTLEELRPWAAKLDVPMPAGDP
jgi:LDH2 family malate/lactate/ureidoglycolate dehydrogenase